MATPVPRTTAVAVAVAAGCLGAIQPKINALLADELGDRLLASLVNFGAAFVVATVAVAFRPQTRRLLRRIRDWPVPRWTFTAGLGGALVVFAGAASVETIGVATFSIAFFAGQVSAAVVVDRLGVGHGGPRVVGRARIYAAVLSVAGVVVAQVGREPGAFAPGLVALVVAAGVASAFQSAFNGRISVAVGDTVAPTALNVTVGSMALLLVFAVAPPEHGAPDWPTELWLYAGGVLGVTIVFTIAMAAGSLGVLHATVAMLAAQLAVALVVDWVTADQAPAFTVAVGAALVVGAVLVMERDARTTAPSRAVR